jgi:hypothetical protein
LYKNIRRYILLATIIVISRPLVSQSIMKSFSNSLCGISSFSSGSNSININNANISIDSSRFDIMILNATGNISSESLNKDDLSDLLFDGGIVVDNSQSHYYKSAISDNNLVDLSLTWLAGVVRIKKNNYLGFSIDENIHWQSSLNFNSSNFLLNIHPITNFSSITVSNGIDTIEVEDPSTLSSDYNQILSGELDRPITFYEALNSTRINYSRNRYYSLTYSHDFHINENILSIALGLNFIQAFAMININTINNSRIARFSLPKSIIKSAESTKNALGYGGSFNLGLSYKMEKFSFGLAVNNLGAIIYPRNNYLISDSAKLEIDLELNEDIVSNPDYLISAIENNFDLLERKGYISEPSASNLNISFSYSPIQAIEIGSNISIPLSKSPGNMVSPIITVGSIIKPIKWLEFSIGCSILGEYGLIIPFGINFKYGKNHFSTGISTMDISTIFRKSSPTITINLTILKIRF